MLFNRRIFSIFLFVLFGIFTANPTLAGNNACICQFEVTRLDNSNSISRYCHFFDNGKTQQEWDATSAVLLNDYCKIECKNQVSKLIDTSIHRFALTEAWGIPDLEDTGGRATVNRCTPQYVKPENQLATGFPEFEITKPTINISIDGLIFSDVIRLPDGRLAINFIGDYIAAVYKYLLGFAVAIAIIMIMIGGLQYAIGGTTGNLKDGQERIKNAVLGLILLFSAYLILYTINPKLTSLDGVLISEIPTSPLLPLGENEDASISGDKIDLNNLALPAGDNIIQENYSESNRYKFMVNQERAAEVVAASDAAFAAGGYKVYITSGYRDPIADQVRLINAHCQNPPGSATCNPKPGKPTTCMFKKDANGNLDPTTCPHTTGNAIDLWGFEKKILSDKYTQCIGQPKCLEDKNACRNNPCQKAVINAMLDQGYCVLNSEPWHFEKPQMSKNCSTQKL